MVKKTQFKQTDIGNIPENWETHKLSDIVDVIGGGTPKTNVKEYWNGNIPWLSVVDFNNGLRWVHDTEKKITQKGLEKSSTRILKKGQIIISARGTVGEIAQLGRDMAFNQSCYGLNAKVTLTNDFLYSLLKYNITELKTKTHGSVFDTITRKTLEQITVAIPPLQEQYEIATILTSLDQKIALNIQINQTLESMAQAIFKSWFVDFEPVKAK
ncbi:MAG: restriction endonuclease subunit S, partial [Methanolobus sp.]|nr:restriction endonuclease subunit S [Methanolobus sp.]